MGGINIERREGRSNLVATERDGTRLVNSSERQSAEANPVSRAPQLWGGGGGLGALST